MAISPDSQAWRQTLRRRCSWNSKRNGTHHTTDYGPAKRVRSALLHCERGRLHGDRTDYRTTNVLRTSSDVHDEHLARSYSPGVQRKTSLRHAPVDRTEDHGLFLPYRQGR